MSATNIFKGLSHPEKKKLFVKGNLSCEEDFKTLGKNLALDLQNGVDSFGLMDFC